VVVIVVVNRSANSANRAKPTPRARRSRKLARSNRVILNHAAKIPTVIIARHNHAATTAVPNPAVARRKVEVARPVDARSSAATARARTVVRRKLRLRVTWMATAKARTPVASPVRRKSALVFSAAFSPADLGFREDANSPRRDAVWSTVPAVVSRREVFFKPNVNQSLC
jgi:hypothetical protein